MIKRTSKILSLLMAVAMMFTLIPMTAFAEDGAGTNHVPIDDQSEWEEFCNTTIKTWTGENNFITLACDVNGGLTVPAAVTELTIFGYGHKISTTEPNEIAILFQQGSGNVTLSIQHLNIDSTGSSIYFSGSGANTLNVVGTCTLKSSAQDVIGAEGNSGSLTIDIANNNARLNVAATNAVGGKSGIYTLYSVPINITIGTGCALNVTSASKCGIDSGGAMTITCNGSLTAVGGGNFNGIRAGGGLTFNGTPTALKIQGGGTKAAIYSGGGTISGGSGLGLNTTDNLIVYPASDRTLTTGIIVNITPPSTGVASANATVGSGANYTVELTDWVVDNTGKSLTIPNVFEASTVYIVAVILKAAAGYQFDTYSNESVTVTSGTVRSVITLTTGNGNTLLVVVEYPATSEFPVPYTVTAVPTTTPTAGANNAVTFTVKNSTGATDANFNGTKNVTIKGAAVAPNGSYGSFNGVTLTSASAGAGQTIPVNFSSGTATANLCLNKAAAQNITFDVAGVTNTLAYSGTITPKFAAASKAKIVTQPAGAVSSKALTTQPVIHIVDQYENLVTDSKLTVTATVTAGSSTISAGNTATAVGGIATFAGLTLTTASTGVVLKFTPAGLTAAAAPALTVSAIPLLSGDVNGNGNVGMDDLVALARHIAEVNIITDTSLLKNADVNGDEKVNIADLIRLSRRLAGKDDE